MHGHNEFVVLIKGGRFEVDLVEMTKRPVYWDDSYVSQVRRCLWFHKESSEKNFTPYEQEYSEFLEVNTQKMYTCIFINDSNDFLFYLLA